MRVFFHFKEEQKQVKSVFFNRDSLMVLAWFIAAYAVPRLLTFFR